MNIKALRAFRHAFSEGTLAAASEVMHLSQPAVSRLISGLEAELRLQLFDRTGRGLAPTREGSAFYREAGRILDGLDEVPRIAGEIRAGRTESLRVVTMPRIAQPIVVPVVASFIRDHPEIKVNLDVRARREAGRWLTGREYDIGVGVLPVRHPGVRTVPLLRVRAHAIMPRDHDLATRESVTVEMLADETIIRLMHGLLLRDQLDDTFHSAGIAPTRTLEVSSSQIACALVAEGAGVTIADELVASRRGKAMAMVPIEPERWMTFGLFYRRSSEPDEATRKFERRLISHVEEICRESDTMRSA